MNNWQPTPQLLGIIGIITVIVFYIIYMIKNPYCILQEEQKMSPIFKEFQRTGKMKLKRYFFHGLFKTVYTYDEKECDKRFYIKTGRYSYRRYLKLNRKYK